MTEETKQGNHNSHYLKVECKNCGNNQMVFDRAAMKVDCLVCNAVLAEPKGGQAKIHGQVKRTF